MSLPHPALPACQPAALSPPLSGDLFAPYCMYLLAPYCQPVCFLCPSACLAACAGLLVGQAAAASQQAGRGGPGSPPHRAVPACPAPRPAGHALQPLAPLQQWPSARSTLTFSPSGSPPPCLSPCPSSPGGPGGPLPVAPPVVTAVAVPRAASGSPPSPGQRRLSWGSPGHALGGSQDCR